MGADLSVAEAIQRIGRPVFTTREIAALRRGSIASTTQTLRRMGRVRLVAPASRGVWCVPTHPRFTPFALVPFLAGSHPAYVSFVTALHLHGLIEQIPQVIYAATTGHTRRVSTPQGGFSFHRIDPRFFDGHDWYRGGREFLIASPEKALVDCLYLSSRKTMRFRFLPEIDLTASFDRRRARGWIERIPDARIREHARRRLDALRGGSA